jgi:hypothetical protein
MSERSPSGGLDVACGTKTMGAEEEYTSGSCVTWPGAGGAAQQRRLIQVTAKLGNLSCGSTQTPAQVSRKCGQLRTDVNECADIVVDYPSSTMTPVSTRTNKAGPRPAGPAPVLRPRRSVTGHQGAALQAHDSPPHAGGAGSAGRPGATTAAGCGRSRAPGCEAADPEAAGRGRSLPAGTTPAGPLTRDSSRLSPWPARKIG